MEENDNSKAREVLNRVHAFLSNLCRDARCDDHCSECLDASDLADDVYDLLHIPPRNCDVGTAEEQLDRWGLFCQNKRPFCEHRHACHICGERYRMKCMMEWAQMPYTEGGAK